MHWVVHKAAARSDGMPAEDKVPERMEVMKEKLNTPEARNVLLVFLCFLLTSTSWLAWEYHLLTQVPSAVSDICTMVIGYLLQAAGAGLFAVMTCFKEKYLHGVFIAALIAHIGCMFPAVLSPYTAATLTFGFLMNLACGVIAGYYLYELATQTEGRLRAVVFAVGYSLSILSSWLLSLLREGTIYYSGKVVIIAFALTTIVLVLDLKQRKCADTKPSEEKTRMACGNRRFLLLLSALVILFSVVNSIGFAFPSADIQGSVNIELSRLIYAAGLVCAGIITDKSRKYGAICALTALVMPFMILSLRGEALPVIFFWALSYFTFGFYSVFRIILFSDLAVSSDHLWLAGFGLLFGRIGDALGEMICLVSADDLLFMVIVTAVLFAAAVAVFFKAYSRLYIPETVREQTEKEMFERFSQEHDLSVRERDMLHLILMDKTVNEIAEALSISDNTVKYHVKNILQKTGCKTRKELILIYAQRQNG
ncbi:MAG: helix-turn-helix transcriptional regulator [Mogibacterium sp.]|nr:helix-turn-helix transcriptional regulator [Mogibacterium sp.]